MTKRRIFILGAGLSGLSAAWHLQRRGIDCQVFEKESKVGGLCRSKRIAGFTFDYDGHLLHFRHPYTFNLIKGLLGENLIEHKRSAWVYVYGKFIRYPFQANLYGLPHSIIKDCLLGFIQANKNGRLKQQKKLNFLDWINKTFGKGIARYFMIPYNTKFWTLPPERLTCEWLNGLIPVPSLSQIIEGTVEESQGQLGYNARFWYPKKGGINQLPLALASQIRNLYTNRGVAEINLAKKEIKLTSGERESYEFLISTIPLPQLPHLIKGLPKEIASLLKKLRWNSIFNLNLGIEKKDYFGRHWIYFPQEDISFFRIGFFHNFSSYLAPLHKSSLYIEASYSKDKPIDKSTAILRIKKDLKRVGILTHRDRICVQDTNEIEYAYPIYDSSYSLTREKILKFLLKNNIISCGRYGSWRYMSMEESILDGRDAIKYLPL
jgi:UDP-galactopyranose mutase